MKRIKIIAVVVLVIAGMMAVLLNNKAKSNSVFVNSIATKYTVTVVTAAQRQIDQSTILVGVIAANSDVPVISETSGRVVAVHAEVGDYKKAGSVLVQVDDELKQAAFIAAEVNFEKAKKDLERYESLYTEHAITDAQIESARLAQKSAWVQYVVAKRQYGDTKITTPISGIVTARSVDVGSMVQSGPNATVVANVVDISQLKVKLNVAENDAFRLKTGDRVQVSTDVYPGIVFDGKIASISSKGDDAHTYPVEVVVPNNSAHPLKAGMFGRILLTSKTDDRAIVIPRTAILGSTKNAQVYIAENNIAKLRSVVVGKEIGTSVEISEGIASGETVIVSGQNNLKDGAPIILAENK